MDTVADTLTNEDYAAYERALNPQKTEDEISCLAEARRKLKSRNAYLQHPNLLDFLLEDTAEMLEFFGWLSNQHFDFKRIYSIFTDHVLNSKETPEKKNEVLEVLYKLMDFNSHLMAWNGLIEVKAYYFEDYWNQLQEIIAKQEKE